jgi:hypothetical protein
MKLKRLNTRGFSHDFLLVALVAVFAIAGVGYLVASHADNITPTGSYAFLGQALLPQQNQTVKVYGCKYTVANNVWQVQGFFSLSNSFKVANSWSASLTNTGSTPYPGYKSVTGYFVETAPNAAGIPSPTVLLISKVYSNTNNYMRFGYYGGPGVSGVLASNIRVGNLPTCSK